MSRALLQALHGKEQIEKRSDKNESRINCLLLQKRVLPGKSVCSSFLLMQVGKHEKAGFVWQNKPTASADFLRQHWKVDCVNCRDNRAHDKTEILASNIWSETCTHYLKGKVKKSRKTIWTTALLEKEWKLLLKINKICMVSIYRQLQESLLFSDS